MSKNTPSGASIESRKEYKATPKGQADLWTDELNASKKMLKPFKKTGDKVTQRFLGRSPNPNTDKANSSTLNLFHSNVTTVQATMFGQIPKIDVSRRYTDPNDDTARVAAAMMERLLNLDLANDAETYDAVMRSALQDRLLSGLGTARVRYDVQTAEIDGTTQMISESAPMDYTYWGDILWSWSRNWADIRWIAFKNYLTKDEIHEKFGEDAAENIPLNNQQVSASDKDSSAGEDTPDGSWLKGEIWEIWDKQKRQVVWFAFGYDKVLKTQEDPLKLRNFFPCPPFLLANPTTSLYVPTADFTLSQDLYNEIDQLQQRISMITRAVKVVGVYNASADNLSQMFSQGMENSLVPVDNWALFGENGGIAGQIEWIPIGDVVNALDKLRELRAENISLLQQVTGMSDVARGSLDNQYEGVGQTQIKAQMGSVRMTAMQDEFAQFASALMALKAEVIALHFEPKSIVQMANMQNSLDREMIPQAIELIKDTKAMPLRIVIRPESIAMEDLSALKSERVEFITALATYMQSAAPMMEADPASKPFLLQMLQWTMAGFKGSYEIEGVMDKAIEASTKAAEEQKSNPKPDPEQKAMEMEMQKLQAKHEAEMQKIQAKAQADVQVRNADLQADVQTNAALHQSKIAEIQATMAAKLTETQAKLQASITVEAAQTQSNMMQAAANQEGEMRKDALSHKFSMDSEMVKTELKMSEMLASTQAKISEIAVKTTKTKTGKDE